MTSKTPADKKIPPVKNPTVPSSGNDRVYLILSLVACFCFALLIIAAGYHHGHMSISAVFKNL